MGLIEGARTWGFMSGLLTSYQLFAVDGNSTPKYTATLYDISPFLSGNSF